jgi:Tol biopolymer transport system component
MEIPTSRNSSSVLWTLALFITSLACATLSRGTPTEQPAHAETSGNGLIAYISTDSNIYLMDEYAGSQVSITQDAQPQLAENYFRIYQYPTWSHDGRNLAFVSFELAKGEHISRLLVADRNSTEINEIFSHQEEGPFYLYWSPDNITVSFLTSSPNILDLNMRLAFLNGDESRVADTGQPYYWVWSPDGMEIFVHKGGSASVNPNARLTRFFSDNGNTETFEMAPGTFQAPGWSPDGTKLLAALEEDGKRSLTLLDRKGVALQTLTNFNASIAFTWSPNGEQIAYRPTSFDSGGFFGPLTVIATADPNTRQTTPEDTIIAYFWAPDSKKIAYFTPDTSSSIDALISTQNQQIFTLALHVMDVQTGTTRRLTAFEPTDAFLSILPFFDQYHHSHTIWSPDSTKLVYTALSGEENASVWVVEANRGAPIQLADGTLAFWSWK